MKFCASIASLILSILSFKEIVSVKCLIIAALVWGFAFIIFMITTNILMSEVHHNHHVAWRDVQNYNKLAMFYSWIFCFLKVLIFDYYMMLTDTFDVLIKMFGKELPKKLAHIFCLSELLVKLSMVANSARWVNVLNVGSILFLFAIQYIFSPHNNVVNHFVLKCEHYYKHMSENNEKHNFNWQILTFKTVLYVFGILQNIVLNIVQNCYKLVFNESPPLCLIVMSLCFMLF